MTRKTETLPRSEFCDVIPEELTIELMAQLEEWEGGATCERVEFTTNSLGHIDSESSPRPA